MLKMLHQEDHTCTGNTRTSIRVTHTHIHTGKPMRQDTYMQRQPRQLSRDFLMMPWDLKGLGSVSCDKNVEREREEGTH